MDDSKIDYTQHSESELVEMFGRLDPRYAPDECARLGRFLAERGYIVTQGGTGPGSATPGPAKLRALLDTSRPAGVGVAASSPGASIATNFKSGNPALSAKTFDGLSDSATPMTLSGTINKAAMLLAILTIGAGWVWNLYFVSRAIDDVAIYMLVGTLGGFVIALVTIFNKQISAYTAPVYALLEGFAIGGISALYEAKHPGIAIQAAGLTFGILACMLAAYRFKIVQVTEKLMTGIVAATGGIAVLYLVDIVLMFFGHPIGFIHDNGPVAIAFSVFVIIIAAFNLVMDFHFIAKGVAQRSPKYMEWYSAFGLIVTLVWLYLEVLRLLGKRR
jgi:uncharacterized YccA/Bax inhibitor family protein